MKDKKRYEKDKNVQKIQMYRNMSMAFIFIQTIVNLKKKTISKFFIFQYKL